MAVSTLHQNNGLYTPPPNTCSAAGSFSPAFDSAHSLLVSESVNDIIHADIFAEAYGSVLAFVPGWSWMIFNGKYWEEGKHKIPELAGNVIKARMAAFAEQGEAAMLSQLEKFANESRLTGMANVAASKLHKPARCFDADPYRLNVDNGTIDLTTGRLEPHSASDYITKWSPVRYSPDAASRLWDDAITGIACNDAKLERFLQLLAGYSASGDVSAQRFFYFFGAGANGKSMITDLVAEVLGGFDETGYAVRLSNETILGRAERVAGAPSPDLLALKGKRLALFSEQSGTRPMNPERIKDLTGGDSITARAPHREPVIFHPSHTLVCCGNHIPYVNASDHGFWRRLLVVPFMGKFKPSRLGEELRSPENLSAILTWVVRGAVMLREQGWGDDPACITEATQACRRESDLLAQWIDECCELGDAETWSTSLYENFRTWCTQRQEGGMSHSLFTRRMTAMGHTKRLSNGKPLLQGIRLREAQIAPVTAQPVDLA